MHKTRYISWEYAKSQSPEIKKIPKWPKALGSGIRMPSEFLKQLQLENNGEMPSEFLREIISNLQYITQPTK